MPNDTRTLTRADYLSDEVYELERQRIFHGGWMVAARAERLQPGNRTVVELAGESVLITRDLDGQLHALANVCRHRGARLCDQHTDSGQGSLMCPYHAWTYALDGRLIAPTPDALAAGVARADQDGSLLIIDECLDDRWIGQFLSARELGHDACHFKTP